MQDAEGMSSARCTLDKMTSLDKWRLLIQQTPDCNPYEAWQQGSWVVLGAPGHGESGTRSNETCQGLADKLNVGVEWAKS